MAAYEIAVGVRYVRARKGSGGDVTSVHSALWIQSARFGVELP